MTKLRQSDHNFRTHCSFVTASGVTNQLTPVSSSSSYPVLKTECVLPEYRLVFIEIAKRIELGVNDDFRVK